MPVVNSKMEMKAKEKDKPGERNGPCILDVIPIDRFPHIWKKIVANGGILSDLQSVIKTDGEEWDWILDQKRRHWLSPQLLPFVSRYLSRNDLLNLRAICSSWCHGVDKFIEETSDKQLEYLNHRHFGWDPAWSRHFGNCPYLLGGSTRQVELDFDGFMESMWYHPRSPFVGGELAIQDFNVEDANHPTAELMVMLNMFLPLFGQHISFLDLTSFNSQAFMEIPNLILGVLQHTLNLKQLRIYLTHDPIVDPPNDIPGGIQVPDLIQLKKLQIVYPLLDGSTQRFAIIPALIRRYSALLERVEVGEVDPIHWIGLHWPNLRELHATINNKAVIRGLMNMRAPQLTKLFLWLDRRTVSSPYQWERYRLLQHFPQMESSNLRFRFF